MSAGGDGQGQPKFTKTPNVLLDELMPRMKEAELRVTLALMRQTIGFHRERVSLSIADYQRLTGLSRQGVINGIDQGLSRGTIVRDEDSNGGFFYGLVLAESASQLSVLVNFVDYHDGLELVNYVDQGSQLSRPVLVNKVDQYTPVLKKKERGRRLSLPKAGRNNPTYLPKTPLEPMQQLALGLLTDGEVGIYRFLAEEIVRKLPLPDIYRAVDQWLPEHQQGKVMPGALATRLQEMQPSDRQTVNLSTSFRDSDLFRRHRLPDEMVEHRTYSVEDGYPADEPRRKYSL